MSDEEGGYSSVIFVVFGAAVFLTLVSWSERREPKVCKAATLLVVLADWFSPVDTYSNVRTIWICPVLF